MQGHPDLWRGEGGDAAAAASLVTALAPPGGGFGPFFHFKKINEK